MNSHIDYYDDEVNDLHDISYLLGHAKSQDEMFKTAIEQSILKLNIDRMAIFLITGEDSVQGTYGTDTEGNVVDESYFTSTIKEHAFAWEMIQSRTYIGFNKDTMLLHDFEHVGVGWNGYVTLWDGSDPIGWIACDNLLSKAPLTTKQVNTLKMLGFVVSQHVVRSRYQEKLIRINVELEVKTKQLEYLTSELEAMAFIDPLTLVKNRRALDLYLSEIWIKSSTENKPVSVLMIDIDNFKLLNDSLGHLAGDRCLQMIANLLNNLVPENDRILARYGGEEFVFAFLGIDKERLVDISALILDKVRDLKIPHPYNIINEYVTVSIGGALMQPTPKRKYLELVKNADVALYKAKEDGKNRYSIFPESDAF